MTPITTHDGRRVVRHGSAEPTPFLKSLEGQLDTMAQMCMADNRPARAVDVGCGNGRNSRWVAGRRFWEVVSFDLKPDYGVALDLERQAVPVFDGTANLVLLQYVLMFLAPAALDRTFGKALTLCRGTGMVVVEMAAVKNSMYGKEELSGLLDCFERTARLCLFRGVVRRGLKLAFWRF